MSRGRRADLAEPLARTLEAAGKQLLLVVTGAGVSAPSGIPTFRGDDEDAIWKRDPIEMATRRFFEADPVSHWRWYHARFEAVLGARPNPAHFALAALERWQIARGGEFLLVTQNIDTLHEDAGSEELIKVHGSAARVRCARTGCRFGAPEGSLARDDVDFDPFARGPAHETLPRCPACHYLLRPHVLLFDEYYHEHRDYQFSRVENSVERMRVVLFVGTSFSVGVTELVLRGALLRGVPAYSVDPRASGNIPARELTAQAELLLPEVCRQLGIPDEALG
ncbi:MAG: RNA polymerase subunit sigma [Acidobacteriota bacterium]|nr:MAG: RNA polymerase subunit sigma [Acidobacteriota bacterium]